MPYPNVKHIYLKQDLKSYLTSRGRVRQRIIGKIPTHVWQLMLWSKELVVSWKIFATVFRTRRPARYYLVRRQVTVLYGTTYFKGSMGTV